MDMYYDFADTLVELDPTDGFIARPVLILTMPFFIVVSVIEAMYFFIFVFPFSDV
jgi:hypothetical protein